MAKRKKPARVPVAPRAKAKQRQAPLLTRRRVLVVALIAAAVAVGLVGASLLSARGSEDEGGGGGDGSTAIAGGADVELLLDGVPQEGVVIGTADAPVTLVEYADFQCPFCADWALQTFPVLVNEYVRDGRLRIEFRGLSFIGEDSEEALRAALAAGEQGKLWNVVDLVYTNQGAENSGWVTDDFLRAVGATVPGLDVDRMMDGRDAAEVTAAIEEAAAAAQADGVSGTPAFLLGPTGGELEALAISSLGPEEFRAAIDELLGG
ncbi:MAG TPA: thioredoxin domain-containing protein [Gaiellaceae bacterium]|nr:thioredoxin domain-containing protein [Gaiellaceae bacterium]